MILFLCIALASWTTQIYPEVWSTEGPPAGGYNVFCDKVDNSMCSYPPEGWYAGTYFSFASITPSKVFASRKVDRLERVELINFQCRETSFHPQPAKLLVQVESDRSQETIGIIPCNTETFNVSFSFQKCDFCTLRLVFDAGIAPSALTLYTGLDVIVE